MQYPKRTLCLLLLAALFSFACRQSDQDTAPARPNIIFIMADDLGWRDAGFNGSRFYETPNLDRLAAAGLQFSQAYSNGANCAPTRASLVSGQYTPRHGVYTVGGADRGDKRAQPLIPVPNTITLDTATFSIGEMLQAAGYHTAYMGKWHLGDSAAGGPEAHGFDRNVGGWRAGSPRSYFSPYQNPALPDGPEGEHLTDRLTDEALSYLQERQAEAQPFFLFLSYYAVHSPFQAKDSLSAKYRQKPVVDAQDNAVYAAMIETLDYNVGRLHAFLEASGLMDNTVLVFYSDNGGSFRATVNTPLHGAKGMFYEGGIRVPCFWYAPAFFGGGRVIETPVISTDLYPTFAALAGAAPPEDYPLDGENILPLLRGDTLASRALYWYAPIYLPGSDGYAFRMTPAAVIRRGDYKLIWNYAEDRAELYNLAQDPGEQQDLAEVMPALYQELIVDLQAWHRETGAEIPQQANPEFDPAHVAETYEMLRYR